MLIYLSEYLTSIHSGFNVFQYITLRTILGVLTALFIALLVGPVMIQRLSRLQIGQNIRADGPESHLSKAGTPTMGGWLILVSIAASTLLWGDLGNRFIWIALVTTAAFGVIGWVDDYLKLTQGSSKGLAASRKYGWQSAAALVAALFLYFGAESPVETALIVPFFKNVAINLGWFYVVVTYFVIVGTSNAVNLTDGLDGLAILPAVMVAAALIVFAYITGHVNFAAYLSVPYVAGVGEICLHPLFSDTPHV